MTDRAVVALSEDRQWLVVLRPDGTWVIYHDRITAYASYEDAGGDTGQDAHDVLREWMEGQS